MKNKFLLTFLIIATYFTALNLNAAKLIIDAPETATTNAKPVIVTIFVDPENTPLSALSGTLSFPSELFDVGDITTQSSIVSVWVTHPQVVTEKYFDSRTRISFEGIIPGGFSGVRSPYYSGSKPGIVFTVTLLPKAKGLGNILIDGVELHAYNSDGTILSTESLGKNITVPELIATPLKENKNLTLVTSNTLTATLARDPLIASNDWYLTVNDDESIRPINHIEVVESSEYSASHVASYEWKTMTNPYVLLYQSRVKYIHVKVVYENGNYALQTIPPVENSQTNSHISLILLIVTIALFVLYQYGKTLKKIIRKKIRK